MKARVLVTLACNRSCENCCNKQGVLADAIRIDDAAELLQYDEIIITGGEPLLISLKLSVLLHTLRDLLGYSGKIYLYSALFNKKHVVDYQHYFKYIDGLHYTIHNEATDQEVSELKLLSSILPKNSSLSLRLSIDSRLYSRYDFSNIDFSAWSVIRKLVWLDECAVPEDKLLIYEI